jgi:N-acetylmuramate 1-kinase
LTLNESDLRTRLESLWSGSGQPQRIDRLAGDASSRVYFRAVFSAGDTAIVMVQPNRGQQEEATFLDVHRFLENLGLPVPRIYRHDEEESLLLLEDLGDDLLEAVVYRLGIIDSRPLYEEAVDLLLEMGRTTAGLSSGCTAFSLAFDLTKLMDEMHFFITHFVRAHSRQTPPDSACKSLEEFFLGICTKLASEPRRFTHRDYHARNLILSDGRLVMIDFQDARMGPAQYDLASLLRDSYVTLPEPLVEDLIVRYYEGMEKAGQESLARFRYIFDLMSLQRNIKALGTFGYQTARLGAARYVSSIPRTGRYVKRNIDRYVEFREYQSVLEDFIIGPALAPERETV